MKDILEKFFSKIINSLSAADLKCLETEIRQTLFKKNIASYRFASFLNWQDPPGYWGRYFSPWRPSKDELGAYADALSDLDRDRRILILGATPELRDLVASLGFKAVVVDFSFPMIVEMLRYAKNVKIDDEIWVKSNWLDMPLSTGFDAILGDLVLRMIEVNRQEEFLNKIKKILSPKGIFATRLHFVDESSFGLTGEEILATANDMPDEKLAVCTISGRIFDKFSDLNKNVIARKEAIEFMRDAVKKAKNAKEKSIFPKILRFMSGGIEWQFIPGKVGWAANNKTQLDALLSKFFDISDVRTGKDHPDSEFYPIYFLRPSSNCH